MLSDHSKEVFILRYCLQELIKALSFIFPYTPLSQACQALNSFVKEVPSNACIDLPFYHLLHLTNGVSNPVYIPVIDHPVKVSHRVD
jgi:hypothetical protein